ncbi:nucleolar MIF4G domain-containing protein 1 homolog isoform X1 [Aplysia californica]|uniref:Nucleolar MIF4G domain-containing protein 1 homolog isoform X1 n=1 Tax=Aplysia californica TaxID=6500 RepID=A0ABM1AF35_APLCA|nr:nucleolar MIF4G domain-containing protein 1 homolog isoform X1 [Aplysia californica]
MEEEEEEELGDDDDEEAEMEEEEEEELGDDDDDDMAEEHEGDVEDVESKSLKRKRGENEEDDSELKEDIYGRLRDKQGNIVKPGHIGTDVPPAKRAMMAGSQGNEQLRKKLKGLLNKVSEGAMQAISSQVEALYLDNSRADVNETMTSLIMEAIVTPVITPERLVAETAMFIAILHSNVGTEIGAYFIQTVVKKFDELLQEVDYGAGKLLDNVLLIIASIYNFKQLDSVCAKMIQ